MSSCLSGYEVVSTDVSPLGWSAPARLTYTNRDTLTVRDLALVFRTEAEVSAEFSTYTIEAVSPGGVMVRDEIRVALTGGGWDFGTGPDEVRVPFRSGVTLSQLGDYTFSITPSHTIRGVWNVAMNFND